MKIIKNDTVLDVTPELIAEIFCGMDAEGQAKFFNHIACIASRWDASGLSMQLQYVTEEHGLTYAGRRVMQDIGDYSHWGLTCSLERQTRKAEE